jgi:hypothetical protein
MLGGWFVKRNRNVDVLHAKGCHKATFLGDGVVRIMHRKVNHDLVTFISDPVKLAAIGLP